MAKNTRQTEWTEGALVNRLQLIVDAERVQQALQQGVDQNRWVRRETASGTTYSLPKPATEPSRS